MLGAHSEFALLAPSATVLVPVVAASFIAAHGFDIALSVITTVLGALLGRALQRKTPPQHGVQVTVVQVVVYIKIVIEQRRPAARRTRPNLRQGMDPTERFVYAALAVLALAYLAVPGVFISVLLGMVGLAAGVVLGLARTLHAQGGFAGAQWRSVLIRALLPYATGVVGVVLLVAAPFREDAARLFDARRHSASSGSPRSVRRRSPPSWLRRCAPARSLLSSRQQVPSTKPRKPAMLAR
jgi:hypothetical protein